MESSAEYRVPPPRLLVGLGNPGPRYAGTRHNIGFDILDALAASTSSTWKHERWCEADTSRTPDGTHLLKPATFMNLSGHAVRAFATYHRILPASILVVLDDIALPIGRLRIRKKGSAGGHNGLASILCELASDNIPRLRVGIGEPDIPAENYVLARFSPAQIPLVHEAIPRACEALRTVFDKGLEPAMNIYNAGQL